MTGVTSVQLFFGALAALLYLEARRARRRAGDAEHDANRSAAWHPELLVRWDDENSASHGRPCTRGPVPSVRTERRRSKPLVRVPR